MAVSVSCNHQDCHHHGHLHTAESLLTCKLRGQARTTGVETLTCPSLPLTCRMYLKLATPIMARCPVVLSASRVHCVRAGCVHSQVLGPTCRDRRWVPCTLKSLTKPTLRGIKLWQSTPGQIRLPLWISVSSYIELSRAPDFAFSDLLSSNCCRGEKDEESRFRKPTREEQDAADTHSS